VLIFPCSKIKGKTNWKQVKALTEKQIIKAAKSDPNAAPLKKMKLKTFKRVHLNKYK